MTSSSGIPANVQAKADAIPDVDIDGEGRFKYILITVQYKDGDRYLDVKQIVRAYKRAEFHGILFFLFLACIKCMYLLRFV